MLQGETLVVSSLNCTFVFPHAIGLESVQGKLYITNYRLRFEPSNSALRMPGAYHYLLDDALIGIPRACVAKLRYPQSNSKQRGQYEGVLYQLQIKFKDLRSWTLEGDINSLMMTLNRAIFVDSPLSLFAFAPGNRVNPHDPRELEGHHIYNIYRDFARMGIDLSSGNSAFRITEINNNYNICPTYPQQFVVPAMMSDSEVTSVAEFRSKGRMPILCYVYRNQAATLWRCAQPKRGIFNAQNLADEQMLGYISYSNPNHNRIWIADCRPEINARVNNVS
jgi:hypothetical protein